MYKALLGCACVPMAIVCLLVLGLMIWDALT